MEKNREKAGGRGELNHNIRGDGMKSKKIE